MSFLKKTILCISCSIVTVTIYAAKPLKSWEYLGNPGFSNPGTNYGKLAVSSAGIPYVAVEDGAGNFSVMSYQNGKWATVGQSVLATYIQADSLAVDSKGTPYVAYTDANNNTYVKKFDGKEWVSIGKTLTNTGLAGYEVGESLAIDNSGNLYLGIYLNESASYPVATIEAWQNGQWVALGKLSGGVNALAVALNGTLYYVDAPWKPNAGFSVFQWNGSGWVSVGNTISLDAFNREAAIAIGANNIPYVLYANSEKRDFRRGTILAFQLSKNNTWQQLGHGFPSRYNANASMTVSTTGIPFVSFSNALNQNHLSVMMWNQSQQQWGPAGNINISAGSVNTYTSLAVDAQNNLYVLYNDDAHQGRATVKKLA